MQTGKLKLDKFQSHTNFWTKYALKTGIPVEYLCVTTANHGYMVKTMSKTALRPTWHPNFNTNHSIVMQSSITSKRSWNWKPKQISNYNNNKLFILYIYLCKMSIHFNRINIKWWLNFRSFEKVWNWRNENDSERKREVLNEDKNKNEMQQQNSKNRISIIIIICHKFKTRAENIYLFEYSNMIMVFNSCRSNLIRNETLSRVISYWLHHMDGAIIERTKVLFWKVWNQFSWNSNYISKWT